VLHVVAVSQVNGLILAQTFCPLWLGSTRVPQKQSGSKHFSPTVGHARPQSPLAQIAPPGHREFWQVPQWAASLRKSKQRPGGSQSVNPDLHRQRPVLEQRAPLQQSIL
jgi:hypothetical protein